jgi:hypothetical protein
MEIQNPAELMTQELMDKATQMAQTSLQNRSSQSVGPSEGSEVQSVDQSVDPSEVQSVGPSEGSEGSEVQSVDQSVAPISPEKQTALDAANKAMQDAGDDPDKKAAAQNLLDDANAMTGGRRRSKRRHPKKGSRKSKKGGARKSKKGSARKSKKVGRSRKNGSKRRAHRKH